MNLKWLLPKDVPRDQMREEASVPVITQPKEVGPSNALGEIHVSDGDDREDPPAFKRVYHVALLGEYRGFTVTVAMRTTMFGERTDMSEIRQPGGQWVLFDVKRPADKIIDRALLPQVLAVCDQVLSMDHAFIASKPSEFTDRTGVTWRRLN
jgi:hypothetical protein